MNTLSPGTSLTKEKQIYNGNWLILFQSVFVYTEHKNAHKSKHNMGICVEPAARRNFCFRLRLIFKRAGLVNREARLCFLQTWDWTQGLAHARQEPCVTSSAQKNDSSVSVMTWDVFQGSHVLGRKSQNFLRKNSGDTVPHSGDVVPHMALRLVMLMLYGKDEGALHR